MNEFKKTKFNPISEKKDKFNNIFQVVEIELLNGATTPRMAEELFFAKEAGLKYRMVRILLNNSAIKIQAGALYYMSGTITSDAKIGGLIGLLSKKISSNITNESTVTPTYTGTGEIYLEPSLKHYLIISLENDEIIVDKGMFYCCTADIEITPYAQKNVSSALFGREGFFQIKLKGTGIVILESMIPEDEYIQYVIDEKHPLKVDGNFAKIRTGNVQFSVVKSDKHLLNSALNGEGLLNCYTGNGFVWIAPTAPIYEKLARGANPYINTYMNNIEDNSQIEKK